MYEYGKPAQLRRRHFVRRYQPVTERRTLLRQKLMQQPHQGRQLAPAGAQQGERHVLPSIRSTLNQHFGSINAANLKRAHALIESHQARGKIVLEGW